MGRSSWRGCRRRSPRRWAGRCRSGCRSRTRTSSISKPKRPFVAERSVAERTAAEARVARIEAERRLSLGQRVGRLLEREAVFGYLMVAPAILYILVLVGYPFVIALWFTVSDASVDEPIASFTGLRNLQFVLDDGVFRRALANTFVFTIASQVLQMILGTALAFLLLRRFPGRRLVRGIIMLPFTVPVAVGAIAWWWMLNPTYSVVNWVGSQIGLWPLFGGPN